MRPLFVVVKPFGYSAGSKDQRALKGSSLKGKFRLDICTGLLLLAPYICTYVHNTISLRSFGGTTAESNPNDKIALGYALSAPSLILIELYDRRR